MKVFFSWSGERSREVASKLEEWLPNVIQDIERFFSPKNIEPGAEWFNKILEKVRDSDFAIVCLTRENTNASWLNFESGALHSRDIKVAPFLFDITPSDIEKSPLYQLQHTIFEKESVRNLVHSINNVSGDQRVAPNILNARFDRYWPKLESDLKALSRPPYPIGGTVPFQGFLGEIPLTDLDRFYESAKSQLDILGHSLSGLWDRGGKKAILKALTNGATVRIVFLDPTQAHSDQITEISGKIEEDLRKKIRNSLRDAHLFKSNLRQEFKKLMAKISDDEIESAMGRLQIAASRMISYVHIQKADDVMLVSQYSQAQEPGRAAPTSEIAKNDGSSLFEFYEQEFNRIWEDASPMEEILSSNGIYADRSRILTHLTSIQAVYRSVKGNNKEPLPFPRMLVILPNMSCAVRCNNCFTWMSKAMDSRIMEISLFQSIIQQANSMGVSCLELSGGGEPLDHPEAEKILQLAVNSRNRSLQVGLLTNGIAIARKPELSDSIVKLDYIRLGFTEFLDDPRHNKEEQEFWHALEIIGRKRIETDTSVRIGVKLLLSKNNAERIGDRVEKLLNLRATGTYQYIVDHIKIKSIRGTADVEPDAELIRNVEHRLALVKLRHGDRANDLQIDIKSTVVPATYRCWINPIMSVIDASGEVYLCCNFYESGKNVCIGSLGRYGDKNYESFWGKAHHMDVLEKTSPAKVCNSRFGCNCRLVHYQELAEPFVPYSDKVAAAIDEPFFAGHEKML